MLEPIIFSQLQELHVAAWNEKDAYKRLMLLQKIYAEGVIMYDSENSFKGISAVSAFIGKLLESDPKFHFSAAKTIEPLHNGARLFGSIQTSQVLLNSMDFFLLDDNHKVELLYAFLEPANS